MKIFKEKISDLYKTPQWLFNQLNEEFHFEIDLCANKENRKCHHYYLDYLNDEKADCTGMGIEHKPLKHHFKSAFCNPPYSNPYPFIAKAWEDSKYCKIVCLVKVDSSTKWWSIFYDAEQWQPREGCTIRLLPKRVKHEHPNYRTKHSPEGYYLGDTKWCFKCEKPCKTGGNFASAVLIFDRRGI